MHTPSISIFVHCPWPEDQDQSSKETQKHEAPARPKLRLDDTKVQLHFGSETGRSTGGTNDKGSDEQEKKTEKSQSKSDSTSVPQKEPLPLTVGQCSVKTDPQMSDEKIKGLQAALSAAKGTQKSEAKAEKMEAKAGDGKKDQKKEKMTASKAKAKVKAGKGGKKKDHEDDEESNPLDSEESLSDEYEDLPEESNDEDAAAANEQKAESKASCPIPGVYSKIVAIGTSGFPMAHTIDQS